MSKEHERLMEATAKINVLVHDPQLSRTEHLLALIAMGIYELAAALHLGDQDGKRKTPAR
jgi:hypothetical protein